MFEMRYEPLDAAHPAWGEIALIPWDTETFGFGVAEYHLGDTASMASQHADLSAALVAWAQSQGVELVMCTASATDRLLLTLLPSLNFVLYDQTLAAASPRLPTNRLQPTHVPVRIAVPEDRPEIERIAEQVFHFGRYHADPYIPRRLGDIRYRKWLANALDTASEKNLMYIAGNPGVVRGFFHVNLVDDVAHLTIFAVDEPYQRGLTATGLVTGATIDLGERGMHRVVSKISSANVGVLNVGAYCGYRFTDPQAAFYWHAPNATHLLRPLEDAQPTNLAH